MIKILIPAKKNSIGVPFKNRKLLQGTLNTIPDDWKQHTYVSSDDEYILNIANLNGVIPVGRDSSLTKDDTSTKSVILDFIETQNIDDKDLIIMLYLTSPTRTWKNIEDALDVYQKQNAKSLLCKNPCKVTPYLLMHAVGKYKGKQIIPHNFYRRQDHPEYFRISHCISMMQCDEVKNLNHDLYNEDTVFFLMEERGVDIDSPEDLDEYLKDSNQQK